MAEGDLECPHTPTLNLGRTRPARININLSILIRLRPMRGDRSLHGFEGPRCLGEDPPGHESDTSSFAGRSFLPFIIRSGRSTGTGRFRFRERTTTRRITAVWGKKCISDYYVDTFPLTRERPWASKSISRFPLDEEGGYWIRGYIRSPGVGLTTTTLEIHEL